VPLFWLRVPAVFFHCSIKPDGCCCLVQFLFDVPVPVRFFCLFGIRKFQVLFVVVIADARNHEPEI
jgi:hypothetical protein